MESNTGLEKFGRPNQLAAPILEKSIAGPNPKIFGHGGSGGSFAFVDLEHRIGYSYVMNQFDASKANADPRSVALSDEVYAALGVTAD